MINRYAGEIHINPIAQLRNGDFNNDGRIDDIELTLSKTEHIAATIGKRCQLIKSWLKANHAPSAKFHFAEGGYIRIDGLADSQLKQLAATGTIQLFDFATDKEWVKKFGHLFGLIWENGKAVEL